MRARRLAATVIAALLVSSCGSSSPASPSPSTPAAGDAAQALAGEWVGFLQVISCSDSNFPDCSYLGQLNRFQLTALSSGGEWVGALSVEEPVGATIEVRGAADAGGVVVFSGRAGSGVPGSAEATVTALRLRADAEVGLIGDIEYTYRHASASGRTVRIAARIESAARASGLDRGSPTPIVTGDWAVTTSVESCTSYSGEPCVGSFPKTDAFQLFLRADGSRALVDFGSGVVVELAGQPQSDGSIRFSGAVDRPGDSWFRVDVPVLELRGDAEAGLVGRYEYLRYRAPGRNHDGGVAREAGTIVSARRQAYAFIPGRFLGSWQGEAEVIECLSGRCELANASWQVGVALSQSGTTVVGDVFLGPPSVRVTGTTSGSSVTVEGDTTFTPCTELSLYVELCSHGITGATWRIDEFGRLHGELEYRREERWGSYVVRLRLRDIIPALR